MTYFVSLLHSSINAYYLLCARILKFTLGFDVDDKEEIFPSAVFALAVIIKATSYSF
jgi:hypothetical protein